MITLEDCIAFCGLTEEEVLAIAEHEHLPEIVATALAEYLLSQDHGSEKVRDRMSSEHFGQLAWQFKRVSGSSGLKVQAAIAC
jgi:hypothetical protein